MTDIIAVNSKEQFILIERLGEIIWHEHYTPIIGKAQVEYMLAKFQSVVAMQEQVTEGYKYYIISYNQEPIGYLAIKQNKDDLFLSKIYILKEFRGLKIGKSAMQFIENEAKVLGCNSLSLTVNKHNSNSIKAYKKVGFKNTGALQKDIGNGFIMDDYAMSKQIIK